MDARDRGDPRVRLGEDDLVSGDDLPVDVGAERGGDRVREVDGPAEAGQRVAGL
jgi:hypothetical protein